MPEPFLQVVIDTVARRYRVDPRLITGKSRMGSIVVARHTGMYVARLVGSFSLPEIGDAFCRDHTTVRSACKNMEVRAATNATYAELIAELLREVRGLGITGGAVRVRLEIFQQLEQQVAQGIYAPTVEALVERVLCDYLQRERAR